MGDNKLIWYALRIAPADLVELREALPPGKPERTFARELLQLGLMCRDLLPRLRALPAPKTQRKPTRKERG